MSWDEVERVASWPMNSRKNSAIALIAQNLIHPAHCRIYPLHRVPDTASGAALNNSSDEDEGGGKHNGFHILIESGGDDFHSAYKDICRFTGGGGRATDKGGSRKEAPFPHNLKLCLSLPSLG